MINYNDRIFRPVSVSSEGEVSDDVLFHYHQIDDIISCTYKGGKIKYGHLIGKVSEEGHLDIRYHQINTEGELNTGICHSIPETASDGKLILNEKWQWTSGSKLEGTSILKEI